MGKEARAPGSATPAGRWPAALLQALPTMALMLGPLAYWFGVADRYQVFLYYHDMGPRVPDTSPLSFVTASRYWMAPLVAAGATGLLVAAANWLLGRLRPTYRPAAWWRVWLLAAPVLLLGVPWIVMTLNEPTLPLANALQVTLAALVGLALALLPASWAARRPVDLLMLLPDGLGLALLMVEGAGLQYLAGWLARGSAYRAWGLVAAASSGLGLVLTGGGLRLLLRRPAPAWWGRFLAGAWVAYLMLPLAHHISFTDNYFYITNSTNFMARNPWLQLGTWMAAGGLAYGLTSLEIWLARRREVGS